MTTINQAIASSTADGQAGSGAGYSAITGDVILGGYFGTANGWFLFPSTGIPEGATITAATITATRGATAAGQADLIFYGNKVTAPAYPTSDSDYNAKAVTTASVTHNNQTGTSGTYTSPSLVSIIQEIVNQSGFNGTIQILIKDNNSNSTHGGFENRIMFKAYDGGSGTYTTLNVTYTPPPTNITATSNAVFTTAGVITNTRELDTTSAGVWVGGPAAIVNTRSITATAAGSFGTGGPERQAIRLTGWLGVGGSFTLQFLGFDIGPTVWDGASTATLATLFQAACESSGILTGAVTVSVLQAAEPAALQVVFAHSQAPIDLPALTVGSYSGPSSPEINILRNGSYITMENLRSVDTTAAGSFTTGTPTLVDVAVLCDVSCDGSFTTGAALLNFLFQIDALAQGVFVTSDVDADVSRPINTSAAGNFVTADAQLGFQVLVTMPGAAGVFTTSSPATVIYCRPFVRSAGIFYCSAHPDFVKSFNVTAAGEFVTGSPAALNTRRATVTAGGSFTGSATASTYRPFTTTAAATFTATATAGIPVRLTIQAAGVFATGQPVASTQRPATALAAAVFTSGQATPKVFLTVTAQGVFTAAAIASFKHTGFTATAAGSFSGGDAIAGTKRNITATTALITATAGGAGIVTSHTTTAGISFTTSAHESFKRQITAAATGTFATNTPTAKFVLRPTVAAAGSFTSSNADATIHKMLTGAAAGIFITLADYVVTRQISVQSSLDVLTAGRVSLNRSIVTTADGVFSTSGTMLNTRKLTTTAAGIFNSVVGIDVYRPLSVVAGAYFGTKHVAPYVDPGILKDVWTMPPRDFVWVMPESDN